MNTHRHAYGNGLENQGAPARIGAVFGRTSLVEVRKGICRLACCFLPAFFAGAQGPENEHTNIAIHVSIVVHNEENAPYIGHPDVFWLERTGLVHFAEMLLSNNVTMNWQSDWKFLDAAIAYDTGTPETDGTNIVAWLYAKGFECDPHAHESTKNYADVAYRFHLLDVPPSTVVGGFLAAPPENSNLEHVSAPIASEEYEGYVWTPTLLWGGARAGHVGETNLWASGIWRPAGTNRFMRHAENPDALPHVGGFGGKNVRWDNLLRLLSWREDGLLSTGRLYSAAIFYSQDELNKAAVINADTRIKALSATENLRWVGLSQLHGIWTNEYGTRANVLPYDLMLDNDEDGLQDFWEVQHGYDITWTDGEGDADGDGVSDRWEYEADTDPFDPADKPAISALSIKSNLAEMHMPCSIRRVYDLESATAVTNETWIPVPGQVNRPGDPSGTLVFSFTNALPRAFYRIRIRKP